MSISLHRSEQNGPYRTANHVPRRPQLGQRMTRFSFSVVTCRFRLIRRPFGSEITLFFVHGSAGLDKKKILKSAVPKSIFHENRVDSFSIFSSITALTFASRGAFLFVVLENSDGEGAAHSSAISDYDRKVRLRRVGRVAKVSGLTMVVLGAVSLVISVFNPLSAEFAISVAILFLGLVEWRFGRRLVSGTGCQALWLVANQVGVAAVVTTYAVWQILSTTDASILALFGRPEISAYIDFIDPLVRAEIIDRFPGLIRLAYLLIIPVVWLGCGGMSAYYYFCGRSTVDSVGDAREDSRS
jgi:hypothetical protein